MAQPTVTEYAPFNKRRRFTLFQRGLCDHFCFSPNPPPHPTTNTISTNIANGATLSGSSVIWTAVPSGVPVRVEFFIDGTLGTTEFQRSRINLTAILQEVLNTKTLENGSHQLKVRATYADKLHRRTDYCCHGFKYVTAIPKSRRINRSLIIYSNRATSDEAKEGKLSTSASPRGARISPRVSTQKNQILAAQGRFFSVLITFASVTLAFFLAITLLLRYYLTVRWPHREA